MMKELPGKVVHGRRVPRGRREACACAQVRAQRRLRHRLRAVRLWGREKLYQKMLCFQETLCFIMMLTLLTLFSSSAWKPNADIKFIGRTSKYIILYSSDFKQFKEADADKRWGLVKKHQLCYQCLRSHTMHKCKPKTCNTDGCTATHHKLLHFNKKEEDTVECNQL